jgi:hypothetical protein
MCDDDEEEEPEVFSLNPWTLRKQILDERAAHETDLAAVRAGDREVLGVYIEIARAAVALLAVEGRQGLARRSPDVVGRAAYFALTGDLIGACQQGRMGFDPDGGSLGRGLGSSYFVLRYGTEEKAFKFNPRSPE